MKETEKLYMNLTYFQPRKRRNEENKNNSSLNIRLVVKTSENYLEISDSRKLSRNIRSDIKTSEVATLLTNNNNSEISQRSEISLDTGGFPPLQRLQPADFRGQVWW